LAFTDIHSHILPGFDDGAANDGEFLQMAALALRGGTSCMVATPHCDLEDPLPRLEDIPITVEQYRELLRSRSLGLDLVPGVEVRINAGLYRWARESGEMERLTLAGNGRYLLADLPLGDMPNAAADILFLVQLRGVTPILAHPERNRLLASRPERVRELAERGIVIQVNSGSLLGLYGRAAMRCAAALLSQGLVRVVASDAHGPAARDPDLSPAHALLVRSLGEDAARLLLEENPAAVLAGEETAAVAAKPPRRLRLFAPLRRHGL